MTTPAPDVPRLVPAEVAQHAANNMRIAYHKTRLTREVMVSPDDLSVVLDFVSQTAAPAVQPAAGREEIAALMREPMVAVTSLDGTVREPLVCLTVAERDAILAAISTPAQASGEPMWPDRLPSDLSDQMAHAWAMADDDAPQAAFDVLKRYYAHPPAQASETGGEDRFFQSVEARAEAWSDRVEIQRMVETTSAGFAKWASPELLSRFRQQMMGVIQQAFIEGFDAALSAPQAAPGEGEGES